MRRPSRGGRHARGADELLCATVAVVRARSVAGLFADRRNGSNDGEFQSVWPPSPIAVAGPNACRHGDGVGEQEDGVFHEKIWPPSFCVVGNIPDAQVEGAAAALDSVG